MKARFLKCGLIVAGFVAVISALAFVNDKAENKPAAAEEKGIRFIEQDWNKALEQAKTEKKLVFVDIYATWCGPCKMLKRNTFTDEAAAKFFNEHFVNVSIDGEKGVGPELSVKYGLNAYPFLLVTDDKGNPVLQTAGYLDPTTLIAFAKEAIKRKS